MVNGAVEEIWVLATSSEAVFGAGGAVEVGRDDDGAWGAEVVAVVVAVVVATAAAAAAALLALLRLMSCTVGFSKIGQKSRCGH